MEKDSGSLSAGKRLERIEEQLEGHEQFCQEERRRIWGEMTNLRVEMAKTTTRLVMVSAGLFTIVNVIIAVALKLLFP